MRFLAGVNNPGETFLQSIKSGAEYFWNTWNYEICCEGEKSEAHLEDGIVMGEWDQEGNYVR
jgi:hypothetical protein